ncbi:MAG: carboxy-S-adenosyl-L-methionine synthase CmoA [Gammaproteobacteria bacterium]|nr:carboxy-S-adenosyl-L-methionine synthase CmoA [Gammaproteobacteria bacterium]
MKDEIYRKQPGDEPFRFDDSVAKVFPDMLRRSIPGYSASLEAIGSLAARYVQDGSNCYDLGCSLGAATLAMRQGILARDCRIVAIDTSEAMIDRCRDLIAADDAANPEATAVDVVRGDIMDQDINNASMVVLNYTLQFLALAERDTLLCRICDGLNPGGLLVLSEKVLDENEHMEELLSDLHHEHKRRNDYSAMEVSRKRAALENVLIPETVTAHRKRLLDAGFERIVVWLRYFNFVSIIAIKA